MPPSDESYLDEKGRTRWRRNDEIAQKLKDLHDLLVIGGYDELHARRYPQLAYTISRHPDSIVLLREEERLSEVPGVSTTIAGLIGEYLDTGSCAKFEEWSQHTPRSVLEMTAIDRLGAKTARMLYHDLGIDSLASLAEALDTGVLDGVKGIGKKMKDTIGAHVAGHCR